MPNDDEFIPNRLRPRLPTTASGAAQQSTCGNCDTAEIRKQEEKERRKASKEATGTAERETHSHKGGFLKYRNNNWKGERVGRHGGKRKVDVPHLQETSGKRVKRGTLEVDANYSTMKLMEKNGIGIVVREELVESVLEVKKVPDRLMAIKMEMKRLILNLVSVYAPQVNSSMEEKNHFWQDLDELIESVSKKERIVLGADLNGHVDQGNIRMRK